MYCRSHIDIPVHRSDTTPVLSVVMSTNTRAQPIFYEQTLFQRWFASIGSHVMTFHSLFGVNINIFGLSSLSYKPGFKRVEDLALMLL